MEREIPVDGVVQLTPVDLLGNLRQLVVANITAVADDTSKQGFLGRPGALVLNLPMHELIKETAGMAYRRQHLKHRDVFAFREKVPQ